MSAKPTKEQIDAMFAAPTYFEARRILADLYAQVHPASTPTLVWERRQAGLYEAVDGETIYSIVEVPESKGVRYSWNVLKGDEKLGNVELLAQAKALAAAAK